MMVQRKNDANYNDSSNNHVNAINASDKKSPTSNQSSKQPANQPAKQTDYQIEASGITATCS